MIYWATIFFLSFVPITHNYNDDDDDEAGKYYNSIKMEKETRKIVFTIISPVINHIYLSSKVYSFKYFNRLVRLKEFFSPSICSLSLSSLIFSFFSSLFCVSLMLENPLLWQTINIVDWSYRLFFVLIFLTFF